MWPRLLAFGAFVLFVVFLASLFWGKPTAATLHTIAFATDPVSVWTVDTKSGSISIVILPADAVTEGAYGYGKYPLASLWKLGFIDHLGGRVFAKSVEQTLGVPTSWYVGTSPDGLAPTDNPTQVGKQYFKPLNLGAYVGKYRANIPPSTFLSLALVVARAKADQITVHDLRAPIKTVTETLPDGSVRTVLDQTQLDELLKGAFEDAEIRKEALSIALYNTTAIPLLGNKAARLVSALGGFVVSVGNDETVLDTCRISTTKELANAKTVRVIAELFHCTVAVGEKVDRADVAVRIGREYQKQFESMK